MALIHLNQLFFNFLINVRLFPRDVLKMQPTFIIWHKHHLGGRKRKTEKTQPEGTQDKPTGSLGKGCNENRWSHPSINTIMWK